MPQRCVNTLGPTPEMTAPMSLEDYPPLGNVVYFLQAGDDGPIKIGYSATATGVKKRASDVQTGCPWPVIVRRVMKGSRYLERDLHERFARYRLAGEWFLPVREVAEAAHATAKTETSLHLLLAAAYERGVKAGRVEGAQEEAAHITHSLKKLVVLYDTRDEREYVAEHSDQVSELLDAPSELGSDVGKRAA